MMTAPDHPQPITLTPIGRVVTGYPSAADIPSQAAANPDATGQVIVEERFVDALLGLDTYPFIWLLTWLHVQPDDLQLQLVPRATEATGLVQGVFASRAPHRPNPIGLSLVRQLGVDDNVVTFEGVDLIDGTPILDIKPWFADCDLPSPVGEE